MNELPSSSINRERNTIMTTSRFERFAPLSGLVSMLLLVVASGLLGVYDYLPSADHLLDVFSGSSTRIIVVGYVGLYAAASLLWFAGNVYSFLRTYEGDGPRLAMIAFGGCVASAIVFGAGFSAIIAIGARAGALSGLGPAQAVTLYDFYGTLMGQMGAFTFAVFIGATGILSLRAELFPRWFGWASVLIALGLVTPIGYFVLFFTLVWVPGVSLALFRQQSRSSGVV
jgi:hypothetical protein